MNINDDIAANLSRFLNERNISASAAAKIGGVTASTITRFLSREIKSLNIETIQKIAAHYDEPILRFINGGNAGVYPNAEILTDISYIDFYNDIGVSAGKGMECENDGPVSSFPIPNSFLHTRGLSPQTSLIVKVNGDSMTPSLNDGDLVIVDKNYSPVLNGIYVIKDDINGLRVKRLDRDKKGSLKVISDNKKYEVQYYSNEELQNETVIIIGKVAAKIAGV